MSKYSDQVISEISTVINKIPDAEFTEAAKAITSAKKIFVLGLGRAGFSIKSLGMRLMYMGMESYAFGETITPDFEAGDLLIVASGSGETKELVQKAQKAKDLGGNVLAMTTNANSTLQGIADNAIIIQAPSKVVSDSDFHSEQPMASLYEQCVLVASDALVLEIMADVSTQGNDMFKRHSNLE